MIKVKDLTRLKAFGYNDKREDFFYKIFKAAIVEDYSIIFISKENGELYARGNAINELLDELFNL